MVIHENIVLFTLACFLNLSTKEEVEEPKDEEVLSHFFQLIFLVSCYNI